MGQEWLSVLRHLSENDSVSGLLQVLLGAGLLSFWSRARDLQRARRDQAVQFVHDVGDLLNGALSRSFGLVRRQGGGDAIALNDAIVKLFEKRLSTRVRGKTLLGSDDLWREYDRLTWQLSYLRDAIRDAAAGKPFDRTRFPRDVSAGLDDGADSPKLSEPWSTLLLWTELLWARADALLSSGLSAALRGRRHHRLPTNQSASVAKVHQHPN